MQLFCRINALGEDMFAELKDLDVGDWIGVEGTTMRTKRGQLSVSVTSFELLSKPAPASRSSTAWPTRRRATASATWTSS